MTGTLLQSLDEPTARRTWRFGSKVSGRLAADLQALKARAGRIDTETLVGNLLGLLRAHERVRAAAAPLVEARMDERTRRTTFRQMLRKQIAAILRVRSPTLSAEAAREMAAVLVSLMKAVGALVDEVSFPGRAAGLRDLRMIAVQYIEEHLTPTTTGSRSVG